MKTDELDIIDFATDLLGLDENSLSGVVEDAIWDRYGVDFEAFHNIIEDILPYTNLIQGSLSGAKYYALAKDGMMYVRVKVEE